MKRKLFDKLSDWKHSSHRKPILLTGGRGVGKTYLAYDFAKAFYSNVIYLNFEREPILIDLFQANKNISMKEILKNKVSMKETLEPVLLILDEITAYPDLKDLSKRINEVIDTHDIILISSNIRSFPDNSYWEKYFQEEEQFIQFQLFPLDFEEYLIASSNEWYIDAIKSHYKKNKSIPEIVHKELLTYFEDFIQIGGMPSAVNEYVNMDSACNVSEKHRIIMDSYLSDMNRYLSNGTALKVSQVFSTIANQLIKENHKFQYTMIRKGATQALYEDALLYLQDTFYGYYCYKVGDDFFEIKLDRDSDGNYTNKCDLNACSVFKLYMPDVGLLSSSILLQNVKNTEQIRKGIIENYVAQSLISNGHPLYFWESSSQAKVDFIIMKNSEYVPIEVRIDDKTRSKNISVFKTKCSQMTESIKISTKNFEYVNGVKYVPIYAAFCI